MKETTLHHRQLYFRKDTALPGSVKIRVSDIHVDTYDTISPFGNSCAQTHAVLWKSLGCMKIQSIIECQLQNPNDR